MSVSSRHLTDRDQTLLNPSNSECLICFILIFHCQIPVRNFNRIHVSFAGTSRMRAGQFTRCQGPFSFFFSCSSLSPSSLRSPSIHPSFSSQDYFDGCLLSSDMVRRNGETPFAYRVSALITGPLATAGWLGDTSHVTSIASSSAIS